MSSEKWIRYVQSNGFTSEELCWIYCCGMGYRGLLTDPENLPKVTKAMLELGMNPNQLVTDETPDEGRSNHFYYTPLIAVTRFDDDPTAAKSLKLLLDHGGDPNTVYQFGEPGDYSENVFEFYVEDEFVHAPDLDCRSFFGLLLCWAYGGKQQSGYKPFKMLIDAPPLVFKDYDRYWYEYEKNIDHSSSLYVVEKETGKRIAQYH